MVRRRPVYDTEITMGIQSNIKLRGTVENLVFYQWRDIHCIRTKPAKVNQAPIAIKNAGIFGMAANRSAVLRALLKPLLPEPGNRKVIHRTDAAFREWLKTEPLHDPAPVDNIHAFHQLSFNEKKALPQFFKVPINVTRNAGNQFEMQIAEFDPVRDIKAPEYTTEISLQIMIASLKMQNPSVVDCKETTLVIPYHKETLPARQCVLPVTAGEGRLTIVVLALHYKTWEQTEKIAWKPAGVVGNFYN